MLTIDLSLKNKELYKGCDIVESKGYSVLVTKAEEAKDIIAKNMVTIVNSISANQRDEVVLIGQVEAWIYLVVFRYLVHDFCKVFFSNGRDVFVLVSQNWGRPI